ncbi:30S ribosomal protein S18 [Nocardia brasiliensis]|uniref:30S ribosomal protein S18 n=1 Tax=Nocardia brasiliensis TaxID=37326 RepID=UPI0024552A8D|nr:30S ribosomal protein S18 [Nocardia brasiliensis]
MAVKRAPSKKVRAEQARRPKKNPLIAAGIEKVDYKDINLLRTFISDRGKIRSRRDTGLTPQQQRQVADADGRVLPLRRTPTPDQEQAVREAVEMCPSGAIALLAD